ncbi:MAG: trypsin-like serine protease [Alphaproteobacteria bacterium]|nr:trypsin-like serine protease [Alphaproteobacteria bacterium]
MMRKGQVAVLTALLSLGSATIAGAADTRTSGSSPSGIKGVDNRVVVDSSVAPWNAVGRINTSTGSYCTGVLIAPDRVATAAHCLWREKTLRWLPVYEISFLAGYRDGKFQERAAIASYFLPNGLVDRQKRRLQKSGDWAVLKLRQPMSSKINPIPLADFTRAFWEKTRRKGESVIQAGYSYDKSEFLTQHDGCSITLFYRNDSLMHHNCDATKGDSGSPIMVKRHGKYHLVGLHLATRRFGKTATSGVAVTGHGLIKSLMSMARRGIEGRVFTEDPASYQPVKPAHNPLEAPLESVPQLVGR